MVPYTVSALFGFPCRVLKKLPFVLKMDRLNEFNFFASFSIFVISAKENVDPVVDVAAVYNTNGLQVILTLFDIVDFHRLWHWQSCSGETSCGQLFDCRIPTDTFSLLLSQSGRPT